MKGQQHVNIIIYCNNTHVDTGGQVPVVLHPHNQKAENVCDEPNRKIADEQVFVDHQRKLKLRYHRNFTRIFFQIKELKTFWMSLIWAHLAMKCLHLVQRMFRGSLSQTLLRTGSDILRRRHIPQTGKEVDGHVVRHQVNTSWNRENTYVFLFFFLNCLKSNLRSGQTKKTDSECLKLFPFRKLSTCFAKSSSAWAFQIHLESDKKFWIWEQKTGQTEQRKKNWKSHMGT